MKICKHFSTLFLLYINDLNNGIESTTKLFADDTSIYLSLADELKRTRILNTDLETINIWAKTWKVSFNSQKTELLNICKRNTIMDNQLIFDDSVLQPSTFHKHLGLTLQGNCKWDSHVISLVARCQTLVACLKSYKYRLNRKSLEIMYKSFVLPHFDYADVVWDNLTQMQIENLEQIQLDALRTIVGTVRGTSHEKIYKESGFVPLKLRRDRHKLIMFFKFVNNLLPPHISCKFPQLVSDLNPYHRRRPLERQPPRFNTEIYHRSFFPAATSLWNQLPDNVKILTSISAFKRHLSACDPVVPSYFYIGERFPQIIQCKLRLQMSDLKSDLFSRHISLDSHCYCGFPDETAQHFLLQCPLYKEIRDHTLFTLPPLARTCNILLFGNEGFSVEFNEYITLTVHKFIMLSNRFEN